MIEWQWRRKTAVNINEIARLAGVSRATVSRYLNDGYVSDEKKAVIRKVIGDRLSAYASQAQMLRTRRRRLVGVIIPKINSDTVGRMVAGISDVLNRSGYQTFCWRTRTILKKNSSICTFWDNQVDGILFIATMFTAKHLKLLKECKVPVVILGQRLEGIPACIRMITTRR